MENEQLYRWIEERRDLLVGLTQDLWETPELGLHEERSSKALRETLAAEGFKIEEGVGGMPTAFTARHGEGDPTIGVLGEFDALPGLSQATTTEREPIEEGAPGHGCGHNLLGVAGVGAAIALSEALDAEGREGTVVYYGCPAEEQLVGKVFMARAGVFDEIDAALTWHPGRYNAPLMARTLAMNSVSFSFAGESAHAAAAPESGRSALDAVQLLNTGVEYMREHVPDEARIHYSITDGGDAPNIVPASASAWYFVRAPDREDVERIQGWLDEIAEGAALMTRTTVEREFHTGCHAVRPNESMSEVLDRSLREVGGIDYTDEERATAGDLKATLDEATIRSQLSDLPPDVREEVADHDLYTQPLAAHDAGTTRPGSTDVGDVSQIAPLGQFWGATWPVGTPAHTWQAVAANGSFARKGAIHAAKVLAGAGWELLTDAETLRAARAEFERTIGEGAYETPLPEGAEPPFGLARGN